MEYACLQTHKGEIVRSNFSFFEDASLKCSFVDLKHLYFPLQSHLTESSAEHAQIQNSKINYLLDDFRVKKVICIGSQIFNVLRK